MTPQRKNLDPQAISTAVALVVVLAAVLAPSPSAAQGPPPSTMVIADSKGVTHEVTDYGLVWCFPEQKTTFVKVSRGSAEEQYPFKQIARIESRLVKPPGRSATQWDLTLTLIDGQVITSQDNSGAGCVYVVGRSKTGGAFRLLLSSARLITFRP